MTHSGFSDHTPQWVVIRKVLSVDGGEEAVFMTSVAESATISDDRRWLAVEGGTVSTFIPSRTYTLTYKNTTYNIDKNEVYSVSCIVTILYLDTTIN